MMKYQFKLRLKYNMRFIVVNMYQRQSSEMRSILNYCQKGLKNKIVTSQLLFLKVENHGKYITFFIWPKQHWSYCCWKIYTLFFGCLRITANSVCHQLNSRNSILFLLVTIYYISQWAEIKNNNSVLPGCLVYVNILCRPNSNQNM